MVPEAGFEPARISPHAPQTCVSASSTTPARGEQPSNPSYSAGPDTAVLPVDLRDGPELIDARAAAGIGSGRWPSSATTSPFPLAKDETPYRKLTSDHVSVAAFEGQEVLKVAPEALTPRGARGVPRRRVPLPAGPPRPARGRSSTIPRPRRTTGASCSRCCATPRSPPGFVLPMCQDTGTATIVAKKGQRVFTGGGDAEQLSRGIFETYTRENLRYSQTAPAHHVRREELGHQPAGADRHLRRRTAMEYHFLFVAKGGGSANKTFLFQETKALLNPASLEKFLAEKMKTLGTAACPPYHLAFVIGGTSAEACLKTVKLASARALDGLPTTGDEQGRPSATWSSRRRSSRPARKTGIGAQFGGKYFALDVRVVRLPRHGASCPVGHGRLVLGRPQHPGEDRPRRRSGSRSSSATRRASSPSATGRRASHGRRSAIDLNRPMQRDPRRALAAPGRDRGLAHRPDRRGARHRPRQAQGAARPRRGPAAVLQGPPGLLRRPGQDAARACPRARSGRRPPAAWTPTSISSSRTAASLVMIAKGNRSAQVTEACQKHGGFYLGLDRRPGGAPRQGEHPARSS